MFRNRKIFYSIMVICLTLVACTQPQVSPTPTPTPLPVFRFQVQIMEGNEPARSNIAIQLVIGSNPPFFATTDSEGFALFLVPTMFENQVGRVIVNGTDKYGTYERNVLVQRTNPTDRIVLRPISVDESSITPGVTELPTQPPSLIPITSATTLEEQLRNANIPLSEGDATQLQSVRDGLTTKNGYYVLAQNALQALKGQRLRQEVPLDVINAAYKIAIGHQETDNLSLQAYEQADAYSTAFIIAWKKVYGDTADMRLIDIIEPIP